MSLWGLKSGGISMLKLMHFLNLIELHFILTQLSRCSYDYFMTCDKWSNLVQFNMRMRNVAQHVCWLLESRCVSIIITMLYEQSLFLEHFVGAGRNNMQIQCYLTTISNNNWWCWNLGVMQYGPVVVMGSQNRCNFKEVGCKGCEIQYLCFSSIGTFRYSNTSLLNCHKLD